MARQARTAAPARATAPPPVESDPETSVYQEVWAAITSIDPKFPAPRNTEDEQTFIKRLVRAVNDVLPQDFQLSPEAEAWYSAAADQFTAGTDIDPPPGFGDEDGGEEEATGDDEAEAEPTPPPATAKKPNAGAEALKRFNERKRAERAAQAGNGATAPAPAARVRAAPIPRGAPPTRAATPAQPAPPAPGRRALAPPTPAPAARRGLTPPAAAPARAAAKPAPAAAEQEEAAAAPSMASTMRRYIITYPDCTGEELAAYIQQEGFTPKLSSVAGILTATKNTIKEIKELGHWQD